MASNTIYLPETPAEQPKLTVAASLLLASACTLTALGIVMVYSASATRATVIVGWEFFFAEKQLMWFLFSGIIAFIAFKIPYSFYLKHYKLLIIATVILLIAVLIPGIGTRTNGAARWLRFGGTSLQPSEVVKWSISIALAGFICRREAAKLFAFNCGAKKSNITAQNSAELDPRCLDNQRVYFWRDSLPSMLLIALIVGLIAIEPDFGTASMIGVVLTALLIVAGMPLWTPLLFALCLIPVIGYVAFTKFDYILTRIEAWQTASSTGAGYQPYMAQLALGSGGLTGMGLGEGTATRFFLPDSHTDFILAVIGQELGFIGVSLVIVLFIIYISSGLVLVRQSATRFGALVTFSLTMMIALQAVFNIAVVSGAIPPKGIALPFISAGGTGLIIAYAGLGVMLNIDIESSKAKAKYSYYRKIDQIANNIEKLEAVI